ncbi:phage tail family protein [Halalkalibacter flavus]|uniref:phage tail family protein n=1 Tax=Halalkalibacter flavus TaxID=3090668 RepID=UPI002FCC31E6
MFKAPKTIHNFKIVYQDGTVIDMADDLNIVVRSFQIDSLSPIIYSEKIQGKSGSIRLGKDYDNRKMQATCQFFAVDSYDYPLARNELLQTLFKDEEFYIVKDDEPAKRWKVEVSNSFTPERIVNSGVFVVDFESMSHYAESIATTQDELSFDSSILQFGQGLIAEDLKYTHNTTSFSIYNAGDVIVNPRDSNMELVIEYVGASDSLRIVNESTGDIWEHTATTNSDDVIRLEGVRSTRNNLLIVRESNKKVISIKNGWNNFKLENTSGSFEIKFDFRFYYL